MKKLSIVSLFFAVSVQASDNALDKEVGAYREKLQFFCAQHTNASYSDMSSVVQVQYHRDYVQFEQQHNPFWSQLDAKLRSEVEVFLKGAAHDPIGEVEVALARLKNEYEAVKSQRDDDIRMSQPASADDDNDDAILNAVVPLFTDDEGEESD